MADAAHSPLASRAGGSGAGTLLARYARAVLGYDVFISYRRGEATGYAAALERKLREHDHACFLDTEEIDASDRWDDELAKALRKSDKLVLIGTAGALESTHVCRELQRFSERRGWDDVLVIDIGGAVLARDLRVALEVPGLRGALAGQNHIAETRDDLARATPSPDVLRKIEQHGGRIRRNQIFRWALGAIVCTILGLLVWALIERAVAIDNAAAAELRREQAIDIVRRVVQSIGDDLEPIAGASTPALQTLDSACRQLEQVIAPRKSTLPSLLAGGQLARSGQDARSALALSACTKIRGDLLNQSDAKQALAVYDRALAELRQVQQRADWYTGQVRDETDALRADLLDMKAAYGQGDPEALREEALALRAQLAARHPARCADAIALTRSQILLARQDARLAGSERGPRTERALTRLEQARAVLQPWSGENAAKCDQVAQLTFQRAQVELEHGKVLYGLRQLAPAQARFESARGLAHEAAAAAPSNYRYVGVEFEAELKLGDVVRDQVVHRQQREGCSEPYLRGMDAARGHYQPALQLFARLREQEPDNQDFVRQEAIATLRLGRAAALRWRCSQLEGERMEAAVLLGKAIRLAQQNVMQRGDAPSASTCEQAVAAAFEYFPACCAADRGSGACAELAAAAPCCGKASCCGENTGKDPP